MQLSVSNWIFGDESFATTAERLARLGCDGVEILGEPDQFDPAEIKAHCREHGLKIFSVLSMATGRRDLAHPDKEVREHGLAYVRACLDLAGELGAAVVSTVPAAVFRLRPEGVEDSETSWQSGYEREWELAVESVRTLANHAGSLGVTLAIEPINRYETYLIRTAEQARRFVAQVGSDNVKLQLDTFHMGLEEADPADAIRACRGKVCNMHLADSNRRAVGDGKLDWAAILAALAESGYTGPLTLEPVPAEPNLFLAVRMTRHHALRERDIEVSTDYLRNLLSAMGREAKA